MSFGKDTCLLLLCLILNNMEKKEDLYYVLLTQCVHAHRISITAVSACEKFAEVWEKVSWGMMRTGDANIYPSFNHGFSLKNY